jgi:hypothetical protein
MSTTKLRKIFNADNWQEFKVTDNMRENGYPNTISAAGCLFRKGDKVLLIKYLDPNWPKLDDFGGQIDHGDSSPLETIIRETIEESNGVITRYMMECMLSDMSNVSFYYTKASKYYGVVIEVSDDFFPDTSVFGELEETDNIYRTVAWYSLKEAEKNLCYRVSAANLYSL